MTQQQPWAATYCDECGQPTSTWPGDHYTLCVDCAMEGAA